MKTKFLLIALFAAMSFGGYAQTDDMYFVPTKKQKQAEKEEEEHRREQERLVYDLQRQEREEPVSGERDVDEYNRRGRSQNDVVLTDSAGVQWTLHVDENGETIWMPVEENAGERSATARDNDYLRDGYADEDDYVCTRLLTRYHGYYSPVYYAGWYDPWFYDPWYYDPWYYTGWYGPGWHAHVHWGWGWSFGWNWGPGWWGPGFYPVYPSYPSYGYGGRRGSSFGHVGGGALAQGSRRGGASQGTFNSTGRRAGSYVAPRGVTSRGGSRSGATGTSRSTSRGNYVPSTSRGTSRTGTSRSTTTNPSRGTTTNSSRSSSRSSSSSYNASPSRSGSSRSGGFSTGGGFSGGSRGGGGFSGGSRGGGRR